MRTVLLIGGLTALVSGGLVHGVWTERWRPTTVVEEYAARLDRLPPDFGGWKGVKYEQDPEAIALTGAVNHYSRTFTDPATGDKVLVMLLCGRPAQMVVHRPEDCYQAAGYSMAAAPQRVQVKAGAEPAADLMTGVFSRDEAAGPSQLRIYWSWLPAGDAPSWTAPGNPRFAFAR
ncbi:MAG: exosortase-associated EpsI family protein, partial [Gemmataceae bacterium]